MFLVFTTKAQDHEVINTAICKHLNSFSSSTLVLGGNNEMSAHFKDEIMATAIRRLLAMEFTPLGSNSKRAHQMRRFVANNKNYTVICVHSAIASSKLIIVRCQPLNDLAATRYTLGFNGSADGLFTLLNEIDLDLSILDRFIIHQLD